MKKLIVGIASLKDIKARSMAIARGEHVPKRGEPKVWFRSIGSAAKILSEKNRELLALIAEAQPKSITELAELSGRERSNVQRTIKTMEKHGLITLKRGAYGRVRPTFPYSDIVMDIAIRKHGYVSDHSINA